MDGNAAEGTSTTTVMGSGTFDRTTSGVGAVYSSGSDVYGYTMTEDSDSLAGLFDRTDTGTNRYGLVQSFDDISGTEGGGVPGHLHFLPVGRPFVDPYGTSWWDEAQNIGSYIVGSVTEPVGQAYSDLRASGSSVVVAGLTAVPGAVLEPVYEAVTTGGDAVATNYENLRETGSSKVGAALVAVPGTVLSPVYDAVEAMSERTAEVYDQQRENGSSQAMAGFDTVRYGLASMVGLVDLESAIVGTDIRTGEKLSETDRWSRGLVGGGSLLLSGVSVMQTYKVAVNKVANASGARAVAPTAAHNEVATQIALRQRMQELGYNLEQKAMDLREGLGGARYESVIGRKIGRATTEGADLVDPAIGPVSLKGPLGVRTVETAPGIHTTQPIQISQKMVDGLADSVIKDFTRNTMTKRIVVDLKGLTAEQKAGVLKRIQDGTSGVKPATPKDIFIVE